MEMPTFEICNGDQYAYGVEGHSWGKCCEVIYFEFLAVPARHQPTFMFLQCAIGIVLLLEDPLASNQVLPRRQSRKIVDVQLFEGPELVSHC